MKTLKTENGIKVEVRAIETFTDNAKIVKSGDYVDGFEVNIDVDATLADGTSKSFTVILQSADMTVEFAQHFGAEWDESGKLAKFVGYEDCCVDWDEIGEFLIDIAESECKKWYNDNKNEGTDD
jgi:hypothetical protein